MDPAPVACAIVAGLALATSVLGTFLPWLKSGDANRNSYATVGVLERLLDIHGVVRLAIDLWPFLSLYCAASIALLALMWWRVAAAAGAVSGVICVVVSWRALSVPGRFNVAVVRSGPMVTLIGAGVAVVALASLLVIVSVHRIRSHR
ncbi:MAG: hypothetical protein ACR2KJ_06420 [Jatrophihabitans sp.]